MLVFYCAGRQMANKSAISAVIPEVNAEIFVEEDMGDKI